MTNMHYSTPTEDGSYTWPPAPAQQKRRRWPLFAAIGVGIILGGIAVVIGLRDSGAAPVGTPLVGKDSGVAACEAFAERQKESKGSNKETPLTEAEYRKIRDTFAESRHEAIRTNGVRMMDTIWQIQQMGDDDESAMLALSMVGPMMDAYTGLAGGCAEQGVTLPAISELTD